MQLSCWLDWRLMAIGAVVGTGSAWKVQDVPAKYSSNPAISKIESARSKFIKLEHRADWGTTMEQSHTRYQLLVTLL
jgi:hypothetical protein